MEPFNMSEIELRRRQLSEVRAILNLAHNTSHELVIQCLLRMTGNVDAVPTRYKTSMWFLQGVWETPKEKFKVTTSKQNSLIIIHYIIAVLCIFIMMLWISSLL